jgi:PmbA protein
VSKAKIGRSEARYDAALERSTIEATIANSAGAQTGFRKTVFSGFLGGSITREGDVLMLWEFDDSVRMNDQPDKWAKDTVKKLTDAMTVVELPSGEYPCILTPKAMEIMGPVRSAMNARMVLKDMSPFKDKVGEKVFDDRVYLFDDGLNPEMPGSQPVDDEGVTSQRTNLIEAGILKGFIQDLHTAKKMGVRPTGNGMRMGLSMAPRAGYTTLTLKPGEKTLEQMIAGIEKGVLIDQIMGAHQASPFSGDFSVSISLGFVIEGGKIVGRFKDGMLAGNVFRMFRDQIAEIGSELRYTTMLVPPVLFDGMTVAT